MRKGRASSRYQGDYSLLPYRRANGRAGDRRWRTQVGTTLKTCARFISTADAALRNAFATFRAQGITEVVVDLRYNGGGLLSTGELMSDLLGAEGRARDVVDYVQLSPRKGVEYNTRSSFVARPEAIAATRIAFIGTVRPPRQENW